MPLHPQCTCACMSFVQFRLGRTLVVVPSIVILFALLYAHLQGPISPEMRRCYELLNQTSRSFAAVIQALDDELRCTIHIPVQVAMVLRSV